MAVRRVYVGPPDLYYPELQLTPTPGETYTLPGELAERLTDGRWLTEGEAAKAGDTERQPAGRQATRQRAARRRRGARTTDAAPAAADTGGEPPPDPSAADATSEAGEPAASKE